MKVITLTYQEAINYLKAHLRTVFGEDFKVDIEAVKTEIKTDTPKDKAKLKMKLHNFLLDSLKEILDKDCVTRHYRVFKEGNAPELYHYSLPTSMPEELINKYFFKE